MYEMSGDFLSLSSSIILPTTSLGALLCLFLPTLIAVGCARFRSSKSTQNVATDDVQQQKMKLDPTAPAKLTSDALPQSPPSNRTKKKREAKAGQPEEGKLETPKPGGKPLLGGSSTNVSKKQEKLAKGVIVRRQSDYPAMNEVLSTSEADGGADSKKDVKAKD